MNEKLDLCERILESEYDSTKKDLIYSLRNSVEYINRQIQNLEERGEIDFHFQRNLSGRFDNNIIRYFQIEEKKNLLNKVKGWLKD